MIAAEVTMAVADRAGVVVPQAIGACAQDHAARTPGQGARNVSISVSTGVMASALVSSMAQIPGSDLMRAMIRNAISELTFIS